MLKCKLQSANLLVFNPKSKIRVPVVTGDPNSEVSVLHTPPFWGAAAIMRDRSHILDECNLETDALQRADRRLTAGARALHKHFYAAKPMLHCAPCRLFGRDLRGERRAFACAFEHSNTASTRP